MDAVCAIAKQYEAIWAHCCSVCFSSLSFQLQIFLFFEQEEIALAKQFLNREMGFSCRTSLMKIPINFSEAEAENYKKRFRTLDSQGKGFITPNDLRKFLEVSQGPACAVELNGRRCTQQKGTIRESDCITLCGNISKV